MARRSVRILFVNCPRLDVQACTYLLLSQNKVQSVFQFEVCHHWVSEDGGRLPLWTIPLVFWCKLQFLGKRLWGAGKVDQALAAAADRAKYPYLKKPMTWDNPIPSLKTLVATHEAWLMNKPLHYGGHQGPMPTIVITETPLEGGYISTSHNDLAVVTVAGWQKTLAPPSALEFLLLSVERLAARITISGSLVSHYPTRGCVLDFTANVADFKSAILVGYVCNDCSELFNRHLSDDEFKDFQQLISHSWLGNVNDAGSVASNLKRVFNYDLSRTKGVSPSGVARLMDLLWSTETLKLVYTIIGAWLLWILARHNIKIEFPK